MPLTVSPYIWQGININNDYFNPPTPLAPAPQTTIEAQEATEALLEQQASTLYEDQEPPYIEPYDDTDAPDFPDGPEYPSEPEPIWKPYGDKKKKVKDVFYNIPVFDYFPRLIKQDGEIGIEIECEGTNLFDSPIQYWSAKTDGSLRAKGEHQPVEYVLKRPIKREDVSRALSYLENGLKKSKSQVDMSTRTSVHVHVNVQKLLIKEVFTYICMYLLFENSLVEFSGPTRVGNLFCLRAKDAEYWVWCIQQMFQNGGDTTVVCSDSYRYTSCNTAALSKFGSLEFRSMRGTVDKGLINLWCEILLHLKDMAAKYTDPMDLYEDFVVLGAIGFTDKVFRTKPAMKQVLMSTGAFREGVEEGSVFVRSIASSLLEWKAKKTKEELLSEESKEETDTGGLSLEVRHARADQDGRFFTNSSPEAKKEKIWTNQGPRGIWIPSRTRAFYDDNGWICFVSLLSGAVNYSVNF